MKVEETDRQYYCRSLRMLADFLESSKAPLPSNTVFDVYYSDKEAILAGMKNISGVLKKEFTDYAFSVTKTVAQFTYRLITHRNTMCERIVVGKKTIPSYYTPEHEEDIVEYKCPDHILGEPTETVPLDIETNETEQLIETVETLEVKSDDIPF